jgi:hypothetical protein
MKFGDHTLDAERLKVGAVIDAGCRDYDFTEAMLALGMVVTAFDIDRAVIEKAPRHRMLFAGLLALVGENQPNEVGVVLAGNGSRIIDGHDILTIKLSAFPTKTYPFSAVKLDIEGSEYEVLLTWPGPCADQITIEYHEHTNLGKAVHGDDVYERIAKHLGQWYRLVQDDQMDTLWVLNEEWMK